MSEKDKKSEIDGREIIGIGGLGLCAFWYKYGFKIQIWFHEHLAQIVLGGVAVLTVCGYIIVRRFQKKNEEDIARMRRLSQARPSVPRHEVYYQRRRSRDRDHE